MTLKFIALRDLEEIHRVSFGHLAKWEKEGVNVRDTRQVVAKIWNLQRKPPERVEAFTRLAEGESDDTHEGWKKKKTMAEVALKEVALAKARGDTFDRADGEQVMASWIAALNLALIELQAMIPPQLEGLDAAGIEIRIGAEIQKIRENLGNLNSELWNNVYDNYLSGHEEPSADEAGGGNRKATAKTERVKVVRKKREASPRAGTEP